MSHDVTVLETISVKMVAAGLPSRFVLRVLELARQSEGIEDLVSLWAEAPDDAERSELEADLQAAIDDRESPGPIVRVETTEDADRLLAQRRALKVHLRALVERHGGVSEVARRAGMPQPSMSRMLNAMSEPRPATLLRLAAAMDLPVAALRPGSGAAEPGEVGRGADTEALAERLTTEVGLSRDKALEVLRMLFGEGGGVGDLVERVEPRHG